MSQYADPIDPFTLSIVENAIVAAADEMFAVTARSAQSPIIYDVLDFSVAITSASGDVIAQAIATPAFVGMLDFNVRACIAKFGPRGFHPGDVVILNDPFLSGSHLNDVAVVMPIYAQGTLIAYAVSKGHWNDVGGMSFGSWGPGRTEIFQEGLQIPPMHLYLGGQRNDELVSLIRANSRLPDMCEGDMEAQVAGMRAAARRVEELVRRYGMETYHRALEGILETGRSMAQRALMQLPMGRFEAHDHLDEGGPGDSPLPVHAVVEITPEHFTVDFRGNAEQLPFSLNTTRPGTEAAVRVVYMALVAPHARYNQGLIAPLRVLTDEGSVFHAVSPAPTSVYWEVLTYAADLVWKALAPHVPDRLGAGHFLSVVADIVAGMRDGTKEPFALVEPNPGGWGATCAEDGESALVCLADGETFASSVEIIETRYPIRVDRYALNVEGGMGHGKFRGGLGIVKDYRIVNSAAEFTTDINRGVIPPWGLAGGGEGTLNRVALHREGQPDSYMRKALAVPLKRDDVISIHTGGGAGFGNRFDRSPERVLNDVLDEVLSLQQAREIYGVVLLGSAGSELTVDAAATEGLRTELSARCP